MLTYSLEKSRDIPLYDALYRAIRADILEGRLHPGDQMPSKRALAEHLQISKVTVENAYAQLEAEGYLFARSRVGYFVEAGEWTAASALNSPCLPQTTAQILQPSPESAPCVDFSRGSIDHSRFPFSVWTRLMRSVIADAGAHLLAPVAPGGVPELREAIAQHLYRMRGLSVSPSCIIVGAGSEYLCQLLIQLLGRNLLYATENPGYAKMRRLFAANGVRQCAVAMDRAGVRPDLLQASGADVLHLSPSHHFPTGIVTGAPRRHELLSWAYERKERYLIEDDYDSEFRFVGRPLPTLMSCDTGGRVIYMNTFSRSMAPSMRISYMVLPPALLERFYETLGFYASTVPAFEQYTLARFLSGGYFEKHLSRMKKYYRQLRDALIAALESSRFADRLTVLEADAGLHLLLRVNTSLTDEALKAYCRNHKIAVNCLSEYFAAPTADLHTLVLRYAGITAAQLDEAAQYLREM